MLTKGDLESLKRRKNQEILKMILRRNPEGVPGICIDKDRNIYDIFDPIVDQEKIKGVPAPHQKIDKSNSKGMTFLIRYHMKQFSILRRIPCTTYIAVSAGILRTNSYSFSYKNNAFIKSKSSNDLLYGIAVGFDASLSRNISVNLELINSNDSRKIYDNMQNYRKKNIGITIGISVNLPITDLR